MSKHFQNSRYLEKLTDIVVTENCVGVRKEGRSRVLDERVDASLVETCVSERSQVLCRVLTFMQAEHSAHVFIYGTAAATCQLQNALVNDALLTFQAIISLFAHDLVDLRDLYHIPSTI